LQPNRFPALYPEIWMNCMNAPARSSLARHRERKTRAGYVRVEVSVRREDAGLVREVASALTDPARRAAARALLDDKVIQPDRPSLKALLAAAPLEGVDLERVRDLGRKVDL
jgi:hypothetical protein